jgi:hypothetical protein
MNMNIILWYALAYSDEKSWTWDILQCRQTVRTQGHTSPFIHNSWLLDVPPCFIFKNSEDVSVCCGWISEQRLLPYTALTTWILHPRQMCFLRGKNGTFKHNSDLQQAVWCRPLTAKVWTRSQGSQCEICDGTKWQQESTFCVCSSKSFHITSTTTVCLQLRTTTCFGRNRKWRGCERGV